MNPAVVLAGGGAAASALLTWIALAYAQRRGLLDHPGPRRSHARATPRGGGIAPVLVILAGGLWLALTRQPHEHALLVGVGALAAVAIVGWIDDHRSLSAWPRLTVHAASAVAIVWATCGSPHDPLQAAIAVAAAVAIVIAVNAWNFMDGIDGLATSQALLVAGVLLAGGWLVGAWARWDVVALAALAGFLPFNAPRARIFLGDAGSGALGLLLAMLLLHAWVVGGMPWPLALWLPSAMLVDAGATLLLRVRRGDRWWRPHRQHLYQWLVRSGFSHAQVSAAYAVWTLAAGALALWLATQRSGVVLAVTIAGLGCGFCLWAGLRRRLWNQRRGRP